MASHLSSRQIEKIKNLRASGHSLPEISRMLQVGKGTAWRYVKGVVISEKYKEILLNKKRSSIKRKENAVKIAITKAQKSIKVLTDKERLLIISSLYWAEGAKIDFNLTNTDPDLIKVFINGLRKVLKITNNRFRLNIRIYEDMNSEDCVNFWLGVTGLARVNLSSVNVLPGKKFGKLKYGMCRVRVTKGGDMLKYLVAVRRRLISLF